ncbi:MAG: Gfo/Idh/MocA family oxidoreductase [Veillonella parvula]|nr:Gfo/Idh/MocA family oxidoreductase [[Clostridium] innocuum]QIX11461.1 Gfo/Idh/MocA family oxidoreductase [[Clostridium] innocuum]HBQ74106.1 hypothetical protein [Erysipelotrichaceae bacterium]
MDVICINSPNHTHVSYAEMALKAGKHILVEKPFAMKSSDAHNVIKLKKNR